MSSETTERITALLHEQIDWAYLLRITYKNAMMPFLYWHLNNISPQAIPKQVLAGLSDHYHFNARRNLFLSGELCRILSLFETQGIQAIPFKGPVLANSFYGNVALRQCHDLDLLVRKIDVLRAQDLLISQGFRPFCEPTGAPESFFKKECHFCP